MLKQAIACIALSAGSLFAQCNTIEFEKPWPNAPSQHRKTGLAWLDPDGPGGPADGAMVLTTNHITSDVNQTYFDRLGPNGWERVPALSVAQKRSMLEIKLGAAGLQVGHVVLYGAVYSPNNPDGPTNAMVYDGQTAWPLGNTMLNSLNGPDIRSMVEWDPDGPGPTRPGLVASGAFTLIGGIAAQYMAFYDGANWSQFPFPVPRFCELETLDPDGPGPMHPRLFALARSDSSNPQSMHYILDEEDGLWAPLGVTAGAMTYHDEDGPGPNAPVLHHASSFSTYEPNESGLIVRKWIDNAWVPVPVECTRASNGWCNRVAVSSLDSFDPDGVGPMLPELVFGGTVWPIRGTSIASFAVIRNGQLTTPLMNPIGYYGALPPSHPLDGVTILRHMDPDGSGPRGTELILTGAVSTGVMTWNGRELRVPNPYFSGRIMFMRHHDFDGPGPEPTRIYGTGNIIATEHEYAQNMVVWENGRWRGLGGAPQSTPYYARALTVHDFDGSGPQPGKLVMAITDYNIRALAWNPQTQVWDAIGARLPYNNNQETRALVSFDEDGPGQGSPQLFIGGYWAEHSLITVARLDNGRWVDAQESSFGNVFCASLASHDPDGAGPGLAKLIASMNPSYLYPDSGLRQWTGTGWMNFAGVTYIQNGNAPHDMLSIDLDGPGPRPVDLVFGVMEFKVGTTDYQGVHYYNGASWRQLGGTIPAGVESVRRLFMFDHDGPDGPAPEQLAMTCYPRGVYRLENNQWIELNTSYGGLFVSVITHVPGVEGPGPGELFLAGQFTPPNSSGLRSFAHYKYLDLAQIVQHPAAVDSSSGQNVSLSVSATGEELRYQWHRGATPIQNGPGGASVGGGTISGAQGPVLTITGINCSDAGSFSCTVSNGCSSSNSAAAAVTLRDCCTPDYNGDGGADTSDILDLAHDVASGTATYPPNSPDFNADGAADTTDILDLANVIAGGDCP